MSETERERARGKKENIVPTKRDGCALQAEMAATTNPQTPKRTAGVRERFRQCSGDCAREIG